MALAGPIPLGWALRASQVQVEERNTGTPLLLDVAATNSSNEALRWSFSMGNQLRDVARNLENV